MNEVCGAAELPARGDGPAVHAVPAALCTLQGTVQMFRNDGLKGMFKGNGLNCIRIVPNQGGLASGAGARCAAAALWRASRTA